MNMFLLTTVPYLSSSLQLYFDRYPDNCELNLIDSIALLTTLWFHVVSKKVVT